MSLIRVASTAPSRSFSRNRTTSLMSWLTTQAWRQRASRRRSRRSKLANCLRLMCSVFSVSFARRCLYYQPSAYPTNMYAAAQQPAAEELAKMYGEVAEVPGKILKTFVTLFEGENAPNPQDVATAIDQIVSTPAGSRPDRVVVGLPFGSDAVNNAVAPIQSGVIDSLGLGDLTKLKIYYSARSEDSQARRS